MPRLRTLAFLLLLPLASAGCASRPAVQLQPVATPQAKMPPPAAWAMTPSSNSLELLDELFSISDPASSPTGQSSPISKTSPGSAKP